MATDEKNLKRAAAELDESLENLQRATDKLGENTEQLRQTAAVITKLNDHFPATREFLEMKGLQSVAELDESGLADLDSYLRKMLEQLTSESN